ncbi:MAG TPA: ABC transporter substrate-binding protein [Gallionella sp.]|nr:ABC transporter substrate-binding protein [Gallionella sp.]
MKKIIVLCLLCASMFASVSARSEVTEPDMLIKSVAEEVLSVVKQENADPANGQHNLLSMVDSRVLPHFDFVRMTRLAAGKDWHRATPRQQKMLVTEFRNLLVNTYTNTFSRYRDQTVEVMPAGTHPDADEVTVRTLILKPGAQRIAVDYEMERTADGWKVFDLSVERVSLAIVYRSIFAQQVKQSGIEGLIRTLADKNAANKAPHQHEAD